MLLPAIELKSPPFERFVCLAIETMPRNTIASHVLEYLGRQERRVIVADWRFHVIYMRVARTQGFALPDAAKARRLIESLQNANDIAPLEGIAGVFRVTVPYASVLPAPQEIILQEANPLAVFSHFSAAAYHDLTNEIPKEIHLTHFKAGSGRLPLGTTPEDWIDIPDPRRRTPAAIDGTPIQWSHTKAEWDFGHVVGHAQGLPIYVTDLERTLLDILRFPDRGGGAFEGLRMWKRAATRIKLDVLVDYVGRFDQTLLRQRVGFVLEKIGLTHPALEDWAAHGVRGSSAKLIANLEFSPTYSERWNLSVNVPESVLSELQDD